MILVVALIMLAMAWLFNLGILVYACYALTAIFFVSHLFASGWISALEASRKIKDTVAEEGEVVPVAIKVKNTGRLPISWVLVEDMLSKSERAKPGPRIEVTGRHMEVKDFRPGGQLQMMYQVKCLRRGYYQIGPLVAETGDLFGLNRRYRVLQNPAYLLVKPKVIPLAGYEVSSRRPIGEIVITHRLFEDPTRIAGVRRYQNGDSLSRIHWRASARTGQLHSKVYEASSVAGATILLDFHKDSYDSKDEPIRSELGVTCAASIVNAIHLMGQQVGLVSNARDAADRIREEGWRGDRRTREEAQDSATMASENTRLRPVIVPTRRGDDQAQNIFQTLARMEKTDGLSFFEMVAEAQQRLPKDASIIAVLSKVDLEYGVALGELRRQGYAVTAIVNCYDIGRFSQLSAALLAEGIETRHLRDEDSIRTICEKQVLFARG
ncbi:MAG: DUF58 domain-containing protein [Pirellulaceae bacterium]|nr:DUF58 domain-containing protein [Planctomycetaceae bacterium]MDG1806460.1 DUF58 domain-containing protein [Pirellulaceae bacterium]MDG2102973.1 DUF58 domain-containing protein [Pirellulaceae bacterium]